MQDGRMDTPGGKDALEVVVAAMPTGADMSPDLEALVKPATAPERTLMAHLSVRAESR
jgi:hypothetical protein